MKYVLVLLIFCAACTKKQEPSVEPVVMSVATQAQPTPKKDPDRELKRISKWFEQMDAILRESLWVIKKERPPQGKSIFGKMQRAALTEMKERLSNKSMFRCDSYSMSRNVGADGIPQSAEVLHKCGSKESFVKIGDWNHPSANVLTMNFRGGNLDEVLGLATGIFSPQISCELRSNDNGTIETFNCKGLMIDYDSKKSQVLRFSRFEYERGSSKILHLRAEVLENLEPVRKIEADVPVEGAILVTETVLQAPMVEAKQVAATPSPSPVAKKPSLKENPNGQDPQNQQDSQHPIFEGEAESGQIPGQEQRQKPNPNQEGSIQQVDPQQIQQEQQGQQRQEPAQQQQPQNNR